MKLSFGGTPMFNGKEPLKVFSWLRRFVEAFDDNNVSERMVLYLISKILAGDAETRLSWNLPGSDIAGGRGSLGSFPAAVNCLVSTYAETHAWGWRRTSLAGRRSWTTRWWTPLRHAYGVSPRFAATSTPRKRWNRS